MSKNLNNRSDVRNTARIYNAASTLVKGKAADNSVWTEQTEAVSFSRNGTGFLLNRDVNAGQLLSLIIPLPKHFRAYDHDREFYRVWGIVQHCHYLAESERYQVGVAFVGRRSPVDHQLDSQKWYRIVGMGEDGLWKIGESNRPFVTRKHVRFPAQFEVSLATLDDEGNPKTSTDSVTENISLRGAAVLSSLNVNIGDGIRFTMEKPEFSVLAVVRQIRTHNKDTDRIHLEFVTANFPIREMNFSNLAEEDEPSPAGEADELNPPAEEEAPPESAEQEEAPPESAETEAEPISTADAESV